MTKNEIAKIIKQGTVKRQTILYMSDVAAFNVHLKPNQILTDKERDIIWNNIKTDKDKKYYNELRDHNKTFITAKAMLDLEISRVQGRTLLLSHIQYGVMKTETLSETIDDFLDGIKDPEDREKALNRAIKNNKLYGGKIYKEEGEGSLDWFDLDYKMEREIYENQYEFINTHSDSAYVFLQVLTEFTKKQLPLKPYKDYLKKQEQKLRQFLEPLHNVFYDRLNIKDLVTPLDDYKTLSQEEIENYTKVLLSNA